MNREECQARCRAAGHAIQSAYALMIERLGEAEAGCDGKHNRVGINTVFSDQSALVRLLIAKGVITEGEYYEAIALGLEAEAERAAVTARELLDLPDSVTFA